MMKRIVSLLNILIVILILCGHVSAVCPEGSNWTATWTDSFSQTTYQLTAPCRVYLNIPFNTTATVTDNTYPNNWVGAVWSITDTPDGGSTSTIAGPGFSIDTVAGTWTRTVSQTYTGTAVNHTIQFSFTDLGEGSGGHNWATSVIGDVTVDPVPPTYGNISSTDKYAWSENAGWLN